MSIRRLFQPFFSLFGNEAASFGIDWLYPRVHAPLFRRHRAQLVTSRVRAVALFFGALTLLFALLDWMALPPSLWGPLFVARGVAGGALLVLARVLRDRQGTVAAQAGLLLLFLIPAVFLIVANNLLGTVPLQGFAASVAAAYALMPFMMAAGLSVFPLTLLEAGILALIILGTEVLALTTQTRFAYLVGHSGVFWLVSLVLTVSMVAGMNQLMLVSVLLTQATRDSLTGCLQRGAGEALLAASFMQARRTGAPLALAFFDIDHFKAINDRFGHEQGDAVLRRVGEQLRALARGGDSVLRWGGEEFVVVLPNTDCRQAIAFLDRVRQQGLGLRPDGAPLTASIGVAEVGADRLSDWQSLIELADLRMYEAKAAGRDRYVAC